MTSIRISSAQASETALSVASDWTPWAVAAAPVVAPPQPRRQAAPRPQPVEAAPAAPHPSRVNIFFVCAQGPVRMMDKSWSEYSANLGRHDLTVSGNTNSPSGPWMGWSGCTITGYEPAN